MASRHASPAVSREPERPLDSMFARIGIMLALYPRGELVFDPDAEKHHWGKRKLKRDQ